MGLFLVTVGWFAAGLLGSYIGVRHLLKIGPVREPLLGLIFWMPFAGPFNLLAVLYVFRGTKAKII